MKSTTVCRFMPTFRLAAALVLGAAGLASCVGYTTGSKARWDEQIEDMCAKDGGVKIYERVLISRGDVERRVLPVTSDGKLGVAIKDLSHPDSPVYAESKTTLLRESNPQVGRVEWTVKRRSDAAVVARWIVYGRRGGDFPTGLAHESSFACPDSKQIRDDLQKLFVITNSQ